MRTSDKNDVQPLEVVSGYSRPHFVSISPNYVLVTRVDYDSQCSVSFGIIRRKDFEKIGLGGKTRGAFVDYSAHRTSEVKPFGNII